MSSLLSLQIKCSVCLSDFTDPVMLPCEHVFCHQCITGHMNTSLGQSRCPECSRPFTEKDLRSSRLVRNMTGAVRQHLTAQQGMETSPKQSSQSQSDTLVCPEHDEKLKLFCETDQKLLCVVCRDGEKHKGHSFKPVKEAAEIVKGVVKGAVGFLVKENGHLNGMAQKQATEVTKTQMRSKELSDQISAQFEEMHQFLKKKEEEIKKHLETQEQEVVEKMCKYSTAINESLMDGKELECIFQSALEINQPDFFLQWWNEKGFLTVERMKNNRTSDSKYKSRVKDLNVLPHSFFLGPYETHLQFFVWKAMLGAVKPVPDLFSIKDPGDSYLKVSPGKTSIRQTDRQSGCYKEYSPGVISEESFQSGKHYWELEVGNKLDWSIGVKPEMESRLKKVKSKDPKDVYFELVNGKGYVLSTNGQEFPIEVKRKPSKIGLYLDCDRKQIFFYDADIMTQIFKTSYSSALPCSISLYPGVYLNGTNIDPITVCSYDLNSANSP